MTEPNEPQGQHPAWSEYLTEIPDDLQGVVKEAFAKWDQDMQNKLQGVNEQFDPYKPLIDNGVPMDTVKQALWLAQQLEENPDDIIKQAIEAFNLDYVPKDQVPVATPNVDPDEDFDVSELGFKLEDHPQFKALQKQAEEWQKHQEAQQEQQQEAEATTQLEQFLAQLHEDPEITQNGGFDDLYVTALMAQGVEAEDAVKQYQETVRTAAQAMVGTQQQQQAPPVVMGGDGNSGSGVPDQTPRMGDLSRGGVNDVVMQYLQNQQQD